MLTVEKETFSLGIKYKNNHGIVEDCYFKYCHFSEQFKGMTFRDCIFEDCVMPPTFADNNTLVDCIR